MLTRRLPPFDVVLAADAALAKAETEKKRREHKAHQEQAKRDADAQHRAELFNLSNGDNFSLY